MFLLSLTGKAYQLVLPMFACLLFFHLPYINICWVIAMLSSEPGPGSSIKSVLQETSPTSRVSLWGIWFLRQPSVNYASSSSPHLHGTWAGPVTHFKQVATAKLILCQFWALGRPASFYTCASGSPGFHVRNPAALPEKLHEQAAWRGAALRKHGEGERPTAQVSPLSLWKAPVAATIRLQWHENSRRTAQPSPVDLQNREKDKPLSSGWFAFYR